jgi:hypothetical protein
LTGNWPRKRKSYKSIQSKANKNTQTQVTTLIKEEKKTRKNVKNEEELHQGRQ